MSDFRITVHLHTILQRQTPEGLKRRLELELPQGTTLADPSFTLVVNGRIVELAYELKDGDIVNLMPALSGG